MTASRALRGREGVGDATRNRILALARKHGVPLPASRAPNSPDLLRVMSVILDIDILDQSTERSFNRRLLAGMRLGAAECGAEISVHPVDAAEWPLLVNRRQVDGIVYVQGSELAPHPPFPAPVPAVFIFSAPHEADIVTAENFEAARAIGLHLAALGHRQAAYIGPDTRMSLTRLAGLRAGLDTVGGSVATDCVRVRENAGGRASAVALTDSLLAARRNGTKRLPFTALMAYNDYMAAAAIQHLREQGLTIPDDLSVAGFDAIAPDWYDGPPLTSASMPLEEIGGEAARLLYWRLSHPHAPPRRLMLTAPLVTGATTRPAGC
jgi:DNA-binding LacI/PurR family transcriptional regulator